MPRITLRSAEFRKSRERAWRTLEELISRAESKGITQLSADELQQLPLLYRATASSLSVARSIALDRNLVLYLENLVLRAFFVVYGPRVGIQEALGSFLRRGFPAAVRGAVWHIVLASIAIAAGVVGVPVGRDDRLHAALSGDRGEQGLLIQRHVDQQRRTRGRVANQVRIVPVRPHRADLHDAYSPVLEDGDLSAGHAPPIWPAASSTRATSGHRPLRLPQPGARL